MIILEDLAMLFNTTKKKVLTLPGCPQLTLYHTTLDTVYLTFDKRAAGLPEIVSRDVRSDQDLLPTLKYLEHQNPLALSDLKDQVERGGCSTWLNIKNDQDYLHPMRREPGLFVRRTGEIIHEYHCRMVEVPIAEAPICMHGDPVLVRGGKFMANLDSRVITPHISEQPCNDRYPTLLQSTFSGLISVSTRVIQVEAPAPMKVSSSYKPIETLATLYTMEELKNWESYQRLPSFQHSQHQQLLNDLCDEDSCAYGGCSTMAGMNLEDLKKHIQEGSKAVFASINPFGPMFRKNEHLKTFLSTMLLIEYSMLTISVMISGCVDHETHPQLGSFKE